MPTVAGMTYGQDEDRLMPIGEAARALGVSLDTIRRWERADPPKIIGIRTPSGQRRFRQSEINRLLETEHVA